MVGTTGWKSACIQYYEMKDLIEEIKFTCILDNSVNSEMLKWTEVLECRDIKWNVPAIM